MSMRQELLIFGLVLFVNALVVLAYWLFNRFQKQNRSGGSQLKCIVMLLCPVAGPCFFFLGWLALRVLFIRQVDLADVIFSKDRVETHVKANEDAERNFVPVQEAIAVTDKNSTRALMMEVVRRDASNSLSTISLALRSEDSEVSHYAASVLSETLGAFRLGTQKRFQRVKELEEEMVRHDREEEPLRTAEGQRLAEESGEAPAPAAGPGEVAEWADPLHPAVSDQIKADLAAQDHAELYSEADVVERTALEAWQQGMVARYGIPEEEVPDLQAKLEEEIRLARELISDVYKVLRQQVFSPLEEKSFTAIMEEMAELVDRRDVLLPYELEAIALQQLSVEDYPRCQRWCDRAARLYPDTLTTYTCLLKFYFATQRREEFFNTLQALRDSRITLDHETLELIRVFL